MVEAAGVEFYNRLQIWNPSLNHPPRIEPSTR